MPSEADTTIEKWVYGGEGLARVGGKVVFVPFVLPGETVRARIGPGVHAELAGILEPSAERVAAPCPIFGRCGGCHYQHAPYEFQLARKAEILREQLRRVGKIEYAGEIEIVSGPPLGYRNRVQLHASGTQLGYLGWGSHQLIRLRGECPVASPRINQAIAEMLPRMRDRRWPRFVKSIELFTNETDVQVNVIQAEKPVAKTFFEWCRSVDALDYPAATGTFRVSPRSFFQVNRFLIDQLVDTALAGYSGESALDLYAGVGLFAVAMARQFGSVTAVESGASAVRDLEVNARRAGLPFGVHQSRVEDFLAKLEPRPEFVLADPPRAGLGKTVVEHLNRLAPPRITIVSCDPATLARDLAGLARYRIERISLVDLFPQTFHLETVVHLAT